VLPAGQARTVTVARSYTAPIDHLWDACTNPQRIARWFVPVSGEPRLLRSSGSGALRPPPPFAAPLVPRCALTPGASPRVGLRPGTTW
jgi:hypothetical protein